jgi:amino acid transporter
MGVWVLGGVLSLVGALCYAELAATYPEPGGDYAYLTRAFGPPAGFLFGWAQLVAIITGSIGAVAYVFADYAAGLWGAVPPVCFAAAAVLGLTAVNVFGVVLGKTTQNVLTSVKVLGLCGIVLAGLFWGTSDPLAVRNAASGPGLGLAMILVLYAYGGWNDAAFVAAEVRDGRRNIPLVLLVGTGSVMLIYLLVNAAYLLGLGFEGVRASSAPAADLLRTMLGAPGTKAMCLLVMVSALGGLNGVVLTGSRVHAAAGADHRAFSWLGRWHRRLGSPARSLVVQGGISLAMILAVGTAAGRGAIDSAMVGAGLSALPWKSYGGGFGTLVSATAPVFWTFFLLTGLALFRLRAKDAGTERPFSVPLYPVLPAVFCLTCAWMLYSSITYGGALCLLGVVPVITGVPLYVFSQKCAMSDTEAQAPGAASQGRAALLGEARRRETPEREVVT